MKNDDDDMINSDDIIVFYEWAGKVSMDKLAIKYGTSKNDIYRRLQKIRHESGLILTQKKKGKSNQTPDAIQLRSEIKPLYDTSKDLDQLFRRAAANLRDPSDKFELAAPIVRSAEHELAVNYPLQTRHWDLPTRTTPESIDMLRQEDIDLAFVTAQLIDDREDDKFVVVPWKSTRYCLAVNSNLATMLGNQPLNYESLSPLPFAALSESPWFDLFKGNAERQGFHINETSISSNWALVAERIRNEPGTIGLLPTSVNCTDIVKYPLNNLQLTQSVCIAGDRETLTMHREKLKSIDVDVDRYLPRPRLDS